ncbi:MAG: nucleoside hydrolase [Acidimicrobiales bacterium]|nr:nucleoside hydrolase [Acidimicrobiales bacterium]MDP7209112.1 nucleoside hydrolase [Acidimicrobiales bacterium]HJO98906.1 nucleoside hydrolase [Acidimicrobiales bacterium]
MNSHTRPRMILDCDPGVDDAIAIITAARWADLVGITTVAGNVSGAQTCANALRLRALLGLDIPIHRGADGPMAGDLEDASHVHGADGLAGVDLPEPDRHPDSSDAVEYLVETTRGEEGLHLVPIGPLTNIALALRADPGLAHRVASITLMGGGAGSGNVTAAAEFNIYVDPEAADIVFRSGGPVDMIGLNLTNQVRMGPAHATACREMGTPVGDFVTHLLDHLIDIHFQWEGADTSAMHDPSAILAVTHPHLITSEPRTVVVELDGTHTRGQTLVDERGPAAGAPNCRVGYGVDVDSAVDLIMTAIGEA